MLKKLPIHSGKGRRLQLLSAVLLFPFALTAFAQSAGTGKKIGSVTEIYQLLRSAAPNEKQNIKSLETSLGTIQVLMEVNKPDLMIGKIPGNQTSSVFF